MATIYFKQQTTIIQTREQYIKDRVRKAVGKRLLYLFYHMNMFIFTFSVYVCRNNFRIINKQK